MVNTDWADAHDLGAEALGTFIPLPFKVVSREHEPSRRTGQGDVRDAPQARSAQIRAGLGPDAQDVLPLHGSA